MGHFKRRLATILSADVAGYSRLMGTDDELTLSTLKSYRRVMNAVVSRTRGRMFGVAGDSWMAEFDNPVDGVQCAAEGQREIEIQNQTLQEKQKLRFRMGVHMGDVIADGSDLFGDEVNIAARLQEISRPGHLVLSSAVHSHVAGKVDLQFKPLGPQRLKNISVAVAAYSANVLNRPSPDCLEETLSVVDLSEPVPGFEGKPALAVLPFQNLSRAIEEEYLADGIAEDLITGLSNVRWFPVISRNSSFIFRNNLLDPGSIGRALGARYLVTGSLRLAARQLLLIVNLIDAENGVNLWGHRYRIDFHNVLEVQDEITASIVSVLDSEVNKAEQCRSRARKQDHLCTWEIIRRGTWHLNILTKQDAEKARGYFEEALNRDPHSGEALIQLAWYFFWDVWTQRGDETGLREVERLARQAMRIDRRDARAHLLIGIAQLMTRKPLSGRSHLKEAIHLNPSLAPAHATIGSTYILGGEPEKGVAPLLLSIRLNPHDPYSFHYLGELAMAFYLQGDWANACEFAERSLQLRPRYWYARAVLIASVARSGSPEKAMSISAETSSKFSTQQINWLPFVDKKWNDYLTEGLLMAGCDIVDVT